MTHSFYISNSGMWGPIAIAVAVFVVLPIVPDAAIKSAVDGALALAGSTVFAETLLAGGTAFHEPYGVLDEFHRRAEDLVRGTVQIRVGTRVGGVLVVARQVYPERVALWETDKLPGKLKCRRIVPLIQHPISEIWPDFVHPELVDVVRFVLLDVLREVARMIVHFATHLLRGHDVLLRVRFLDLDHVPDDTKILVPASPSIKSSAQTESRGGFVGRVSCVRLVHGGVVAVYGIHAR